MVSASWGSTLQIVLLTFEACTGVYRVSKSIISYYDTQIVGELSPAGGGMPVIQVATTFTGNGVFSSDVYLADGKSEWYLNTVSLFSSKHIDFRFLLRV